MGVRLLFLVELRETPFFTEHFSDSKIYLHLASRIRGEGIPHVYFMSPLYPYLLAAIWTLTDNPELWVRLLQALFGGATTLLTYVLGRSLFGRVTGGLAALIVALYAPLIYYDALLLTESLLTLLLTGHMTILVTAWKSNNIRWWIAAGLMLGLAVITRATVLLFPLVLFLVWIFLDKKTRPKTSNLLAYVLAAMLLLLPTTIRNAAVEGVFVPVTSSFGFNLYAGNNADATGQYSMPEKIDILRDPGGKFWVERQTDEGMNAVEVSAYWRSQALAWMSANPGEAAALFFRKVLLFFHPAEIDQLGLSLRFFTREYGPVPGIPAAAYPILLVLSMIGVAVTERKRTVAWLPVLFILVYVMATAFFFVSARLRLPIMPLLILYASFAAVGIVQRLRERKFRELRFPVLSGGGIAITVLLLQPGVQQVFEQEYIKLGKAAFLRESYSEAEDLFRRSLAQRETVDGLVNLGNALAAQGQPGEAAEKYREAIRRDSTSALAWFNFGNLHMQNGKPQYAYGFWKRATEYDPRMPEARRNFGLLLMQAGRFREAEEQLQIYLTLEEDPARRNEIARDLERLQHLIDAGPSSRE
ncbi:MAG: glycosyltransferase family 39 protein [Bacteroidetes bacterium]|nr:glycosyltransferase family 39 protein [Bacteroidota bacterium]